LWRKKEGIKGGKGKSELGREGRQYEEAVQDVAWDLGCYYMRLEVQMNCFGQGKRSGKRKKKTRRKHYI